LSAKLKTLKDKVIIYKQNFIFISELNRKLVSKVQNFIRLLLFNILPYEYVVHYNSEH